MTRFLAVISEIRQTAHAIKVASEEADHRATHLSQMMSALEEDWQGMSQVKFYAHYHNDSVQLKRFSLLLNDTSILLDKVGDEIVYFDEHLLSGDGAVVSPFDPNHPGNIDPNMGSVNPSGNGSDPGHGDQVNHDDQGHVNQSDHGQDNGNNGQHVGGDQGQQGSGGQPSGQGWTPPGQSVGGSDSGGGGSSDSSGSYIGFGAALGIAGAAGAAGAASSDTDSTDGTTTDTVSGDDKGTTDPNAPEGEKFWGRFKGLTSDPKAGWGCVSYVLSSTFVPWTMMGHWNAGNAKEWIRNAQRWNQLHPEYQITVDHNPRKGAVAVFPDWGGGYGHVAKVTSTDGKNFSFLQGNTFFGNQETPQGHYFNNKGELDVPYLLNGSVETSGHNEVWFIHFPWSEM